MKQGATQTFGCGPDGAPFADPEPFAVEAAGQSMTFYPRGEDRKRAMLDLVADARETLQVCFYIFAKDETGSALRDAMVEAARRGVSVTLVVDTFGADADAAFFADLLEAGGAFHTFSSRWSHRYLIRNHQKMIIADGKRALFGGFNIQDDYFDPPESNGWNDLAIDLTGSAVAGLQKWFAKLKDWVDDDSAKFRQIRYSVRDWEWSDGNAQWLIGGPTRGLSSWASRVKRDLENGSRLDMFMAYFSPPKALLKAIGAIAEKGETRLLMAARSDNNATLGATRSLYGYLLYKGARVWEFSPCKLHTKLVVLDDAVYLGSANFDMRSLYLNLELMLRIEDKALADRMRDFVSDHIAASQAITPQAHKKHATLLNRVRWNLGWLLVSVLDYNVSRRLNLGL